MSKNKVQLESSGKKQVKVEDRKVVLRSSIDNGRFEVDLAIAQEIEFVMNTIEEIGEEQAIFLDIPSKILTKVINYCTYHAQCKQSNVEKPALSKDGIKQWDADLLDSLDYDTLVDLINAANYLKMTFLAHLVGKKIADKITYMIDNATLEDFRKYFRIEKDDSPTSERNWRKQRNNELAFR